MITLLNRVAGRLAILSGNRVSTSTLQTPIIYGYHTHATPGNLPSPFVATNNSWPPWYEEEHDPWNAHLRGEHSASSSGATIRTRQSAAQTAIPHGFCQSAIGDLPTTTRLTDAMTYRYSLVDIPRRTEPWGPFPIHFTALKMNPFKRTTSFVPAHVPAARPA